MLVPFVPGPIATVTLTASHGAPQVQGTSIVFTAAGTGGTAPYQYKFWLYDGTTWTIGQNWSPTATFTWTPAAASANYKVWVWARSAGNTANASERMAGGSFAILSTQ